MFRRNKSALLNTKDDRVTIINNRINLAEKHFLDLASNFAGATRKMAKYRDSYDDLAKCLKSYGDAEDMNETLGEGMKNAANAVTIMGDYMDLKVHRMELRIVNELAQFETMCKTTRDNLRSAVNARDKELSKQRQMEEIKTKFSANNSAADSELMKAKLALNRANKQIDSIINAFEKQKLTNIRTILTDFILISMKYHAKVLEALTASYYDVSNVDVKRDLVDFQKLMKSKAEPQKQNNEALKKGFRSKSMENLDQEALSPLKRESKIWRSNKNLTDKSDTISHDEAEVDEEDDDEDGSDENQSNSDEDGSVTASDDKQNNPTDDATETDSLPSEAKPLAVDTKSRSSQPFKAIASTHVRVQSTIQPQKPLRVNPRPSRLPTPLVRTAADAATSRLVTFVESKQLGSSAQHAAKPTAANRNRRDTPRPAF